MTKRNTVELEVLNISNSMMQAGAFAMLLGEVGGQRRLPIIIGAFEAQAILIEMKGITPPRPLTYILFASVLDVLHVRLQQVLIYKADNGIFYSYLFLKTENSIIRVDARTSDAVALSMHMGAPILIYEDVLEAEKMHAEQDTEDRNSEDSELEILQNALQKAVEEENYEQAAVLRDKINQLRNQQ